MQSNTADSSITNQNKHCQIIIDASKIEIVDNRDMVTIRIPTLIYVDTQNSVQIMNQASLHELQKRYEQLYLNQIKKIESRKEGRSDPNDQNAGREILNQNNDKNHYNSNQGFMPFQQNKSSNSNLANFNPFIKQGNQQKEFDSHLPRNYDAQLNKWQTQPIGQTQLIGQGYSMNSHSSYQSHSANPFQVQKAVESNNSLFGPVQAPMPDNSSNRRRQKKTGKVTVI